MIAATTQGGFFLPDDVRTQLLPRPRQKSYDWIINNVVMPDGRPFDPYAYPWTKGICDAWDHPDVRIIWLQFAARCGKTAIAQGLTVASIAHRPAPSLFATSTKDLAVQTIKLKLLPMLRECSETRPWVPPEHDIKQTRLDLRHSTVFVGWSGSPTTLGDIPARYSHGNEIDKWDKSKSDEADPLELFFERGAEIPDRKSIVESTPTITGHSRVNRGLVNGSNCRFPVPCKRCGHFQQLRLGDRNASDGGLLWDRDEDGRSTMDLAYRTARYVCAKCRKELHDEDRRPMISRGVWCPMGSYVSKNGVVRPERVMRPDESFQLSRIYSPSFTFGQFARAFVRAEDNRELLRNWVNSWDGETWDLRTKQKTWDALASRLVQPSLHMGRLPPEALFMVAGVDVQVDHLVYVKMAFGRDRKGWVIDYGITPAFTELRDELDREYEHPDGGRPLFVRYALMDSRFRQDEVDEFCLALSKVGRWVCPSMGSRPGTMHGKPYRTETFENHRIRTKKQRFDEIFRVYVNTSFWQNWIQSCIDVRRPGDPNSFAMPAESIDDQDFYEQLLNEVPEGKKSATGQDEETLYVVVSESTPVDFRDCVRYARCAADIYVRRAWERLLPRPQKGISKPTSDREPGRAAESTEGKRWIKRRLQRRELRRS